MVLLAISYKACVCLVFMGNFIRTKFYDKSIFLSESSLFFMLEILFLFLFLNGQNLKIIIRETHAEGDAAACEKA